MTQYYLIICILISFCGLIDNAAYSCGELDKKFPCSCNSSDTEGLVIKCNFCPKMCSSRNDKGKSTSDPFTAESLKKFVSSIQQKISYLSISCINLDSIPDDYFHGIQMTHFRCYKCNLASISSKSFSGLEDTLAEIDLQENKLTKISDGFKDLKALKKISLANNNISFVDKNAFKNSENNLEDINIQDNRLDSISAFKNIKKLKNLNICSNKIEIPQGPLELSKTLESLEICRGTFSKITKNTFKDFKDLKQLEITNSKLKSIESGSFNDLKRISKIVLAYNEFPQIDGVFVNLPELEELYLYNNKISHIKEKTFQGCSELKTLNMVYNEIEKIDSKSFQDLTSLKSIALTGNKIQEIQENTFKGATKLINLSLDSNNIALIHQGAFNGLNSLEDLGLASNGLTEIKQGTFIIPSLKKLDLSNNAISKIEAGVFDHLNLTSLSLYGNKMSTYAESLFAKLPHLTERNFKHSPPIYDDPYFCIERE